MEALNDGWGTSYVKPLELTGSMKVLLLVRDGLVLVQLYD
jgi:hypothetical protein